MPDWNRYPWKPGDLALYSPDQRHAFGCVVECEPWTLGDGRRRVTTVRALGPAYAAAVGRPGRARSAGVYCGALRPAPTELVDGRWIVPTADGPEPSAVVTYTEEPSPETGHVGWVWWALGKMGEAESYEDAKAQAEAAVRRVIADRMAIL